MRRPLVCFVALVLLLSGCVAAPEPDAGPTSSGAPTEAETPPQDGSVDDPTAVVTIASVDVDGLHLTIAGFITVIAESGGTCEFSVTSAVSGAVVTRSTVGQENVDSTSCGSLQIPVIELSKGPWDAALTYMSGDVDVTSDPERVEIP